MKSSSITPATLDERLSFTTNHRDAFAPPEGGWLRVVRDSLAMSQREAAAAAGVTQQAFDQFESGELRASITMERLQKAAAALGCELVYFLRPVEGSNGSFVSLAERRSRTKRAVTKALPPPPRYEDDTLPVNLL